MINKSYLDIHPIIGQQFYTTDEVAAYMRITRQTLYWRVRKGKMPPLQGIGHKKGYLGTTIVEILTGGKAANDEKGAQDVA